jgi:hypothetical protein
MAIEKLWETVPTQLFVTNGGVGGQATIISTVGVKVKQKIFIGSNTQPQIQLEVKSVLNETDLILGPIGAPIRGAGSTIDLSLYTTADNSYFRADSQVRPSIVFSDVNRAVYEEEPTVAIRTFNVDHLGRRYSIQNPLPVQVSNSQSPTIFNLDATVADGEYSYVLPTSTKQFTIKDRAGDAKIRLSYAVGGTADGQVYETIKMGNTHQVTNINTTPGFTIYVRSNKGSRVFEIVSWA